MQDLRTLLRAVVEDHHTLTRAEARALLTTVFDEPTLPEHILAELASLLTALALRGETPEELTGLVDAMRAASTPLPLTEQERSVLVDTCGTGGDALGTFNISTASALVAAAAGAHVAKHGNRAVTSRTGSADVLQALGVPIDLTPDQAATCLRQTGFVFLLAPIYHPALRHLASLRRALPFRTVFHLAGPLSNPAGAQAQVMGLWSSSRIPTVARAMQLLGIRQAFIVHGESDLAGQDGAGGLDEWTTTGRTHYAHLRSAPGLGAGFPPSAAQAPAEAVIPLQSLTPEELGIPRAPLSALYGGDSPETSAAILQAIFEGREDGPPRDVVLLNASAALVAASHASTLREGIAQAAHAIDSGAATRLLAALREF